MFSSSWTRVGVADPVGAAELSAAVAGTRTFSAMETTVGVALGRRIDADAES